MPGSVEGGKAAALTNKLLYGHDYYRRLGALGGSVKNALKGFASNRELASKAGKIGGKISKRGKAKKNV